MAEEVQKFRSSISGFNREDVVNFIGTLNAQHETEVSSLREENGRLNDTVKSLQEALSQVQAELREAKTALEAKPEPSEAQPTDWRSEELAAYRRAEEVERQSRERAAELHRALTAMVADASVKMDEASSSLSQVMVQLNTDILQLRESMDDGKAVLTETARALRASGGRNE